MFTQQKIMNRVHELIADGYLYRGSTPNTIILTEKGLACLMATAERPIKKSRVKTEDRPKKEG